MVGWRRRPYGLFSSVTGTLDAWARGERNMRRIGLACAALVMLASPLRAQQVPPEQPVPAQAAPDQTVPPPPASQPGSELPPPFIPPPPARAYDDYRPRSHHHARVHRHARSHHHARAHRRGIAHARVVHRHHRARHISMRASRRCHRMSYRQIIRHSICSALIKRDLQAAEHRHVRVSRHHRFSHHHRSRRHRR